MGNMCQHVRMICLTSEATFMSLIFLKQQLLYFLYKYCLAKCIVSGLGPLTLNDEQFIHALFAAVIIAAQS